jgi:hypothetical protein
MSIFLCFVWACDNIREVEPPQILSNEVQLIDDKRYYVQPNNYIAIDTKVLLKNGGLTAFKLQTIPEYGDIVFTKNGYLIYKSDSAKSEVSEIIIYKAVNGTTKKNIVDTIMVNIVNDVNKMPCNAGAIADFFEVNTNTTTALDVLKNDRFCNAILDSSSLQIIENPINGTAIIEQNKIKYTPRPNREADILFYQICTAGSNPICRIVGVRIDIQATNSCKTVLMPDIIAIAKGNTAVQTIKVLDNDKLCENYNYKSLQVVGEPRFGKATINKNFEIEYIQTANKEGNDQFEYLIVDKEGKNPLRTSVQVMIKNVPVCKAVLKNGQMEVSSSQVKNAEIEIPYSLFLSTCAEISQVSIDQLPVNGTIRVDGKKIYYKIKPDGKEYTDTFKYAVTTKLEVLKANFTIRIKK